MITPDLAINSSFCIINIKISENTSQMYNQSNQNFDTNLSVALSFKNNLFEKSYGQKTCFFKGNIFCVYPVNVYHTKHSELFFAFAIWHKSTLKSIRLLDLFWHGNLVLYIANNTYRYCRVSWLTKVVRKFIGRLGVGKRIYFFNMGGHQDTAQ